MGDPGLNNLRWAFALMDGLAAAGVERALISPGSRSTPLVLACDRHPGIHTRVHVDERGAAFMALGQAKASQVPSVVIGTSGSAATHWYPAVVEASLSHTPMILLSADRPPELQDWGANQTLDQLRLFGIHVRAFHQAGLPEDDDAALRQIRHLGIKAVDQALTAPAGPVHINLPFREPLVPQCPPADWPSTPSPRFFSDRQRPDADPARLDALARRLQAGHGLIVCGPAARSEDFASAAVALARRLGAPLLADPLSGVRFGPWINRWVVARYDAFLRDSMSAAPVPDWVLRFGAAPVSRRLLDFLDRQPGLQVLVNADGDWPDPMHRTGQLIRAEPSRFCRQLAERVRKREPNTWGDWYLRAEEVAGAAAEVPLAGRLTAELIRQLPAGCLLFSSNSLAIRYLDTWSGRGPKPLHILANRGVSGIDGNVSTLAGLQAISRSRVVGLIGDVALLHDLNGLAAIRDQEPVIVILDNGGGAIFSLLPQSELPRFERYWLTPPGLDLETVAQLFGLGFHCASSVQVFAQALSAALARPGPQLLQVRLPADPERPRQGRL
jgi:2-succinyl-5-enolpyruvyl-6-hydroxy-3-cyclohexene-1-carboxylate synthase